MALFSNSMSAHGAEKITPLLRDRIERQPDRQTALASPPGVVRPIAEAPEPDSEDAFPSFMLPTLATPDDIRELVRYLRKKPSGVTIVEAMEAMRNKTLHPGKITAYEYLGLVQRQGDRLKLSPHGWDFVQKLQPEAQAFRDVLSLTPAYRSLLDWIHQSGPELVTQADVADFWQKYHAGELDTRNEKALTSSVVCFFHLCQAAELGTLTIGKRGQPARLRVDQGELASWQTSGAPAVSHDPGGALRRETPSAFAPEPQRQLTPVGLAAERPRVLISCRERAALINQIQATLELADIESEVVERNDERSLLLHEELFRALRRCHAAIIVITPGDFAGDQADNPLSPGVLLEISSAFVHYNRQVVLMRDRQTVVPAQLGELPQCEFDGEEMTWAAGVGLLKLARNFRRSNL